MNTVRITFIFLVLLLFFTFYTSGEVLLSFNSGLTFIGNDDDSAYPVQPLIFTGGVTVPVYLSQYLYLKPGLSLTGTNYRYTGSKVVPESVEYREYWVLIPVLDCYIGFNLALGKTDLSLGMGIGPAFLPRIPVSQLAEDNNFNSVLNWLYSQGRFFCPGMELYGKWDVETDFSLIFAAKLLYPLVHLWDNENVAFWDQMLISASVGFTFPLGGSELAKQSGL